MLVTSVQCYFYHAPRGLTLRELRAQVFGRQNAVIDKLLGKIGQGLALITELTLTHWREESCIRSLMVDAPGRARTRVEFDFAPRLVPIVVLKKHKQFHHLGDDVELLEWGSAVLTFLTHVFDFVLIKLWPQLWRRD